MFYGIALAISLVITLIGGGSGISNAIKEGKLDDPSEQGAKKDHQQIIKSNSCKARN